MVDALIEYPTMSLSKITTSFSIELIVLELSELSDLSIRLCNSNSLHQETMIKVKNNKTNANNVVLSIMLSLIGLMFKKKDDIRGKNMNLGG